MRSSPTTTSSTTPFAGEGREGVKRFFERLVPLPPWLDAGGTTTVNLIAQDDFMVRQEMRTRGMLVDVFRVRNGLCVEHWDAYRPDRHRPHPGF